MVKGSSHTCWAMRSRQAVLLAGTPPVWMSQRKAYPVSARAELKCQDSSPNTGTFTVIGRFLGSKYGRRRARVLPLL